MPAITPTLFRDQLFGALSTFWAARTPIFWPNLNADPAALGPDATAYIKPSIVDQAEGQAQLTSSVTPQLLSREGIFGVELFTRGEASEDLSLSLKDALLQFVERVPRSVEGAIFRRRGSQTIGFGGVWYQVNVTAAFLYFTDRAP